MTGNRPLSNWVARAAEIAGTGLWRITGQVNDGDERADARHMPEFADGWWRRPLAMEPYGSVLGLTHAASGRTVVELGGTAEPVAVGSRAVEILARIESEPWPHGELDPAERDTLKAEDPAVVHLLLSRWAAEGTPSAQCFHLLPWEWVDQMVAGVLTVMRGEGAPASTRLRFFFSPAGSRFTAALEQLDSGVRGVNRAIAWKGATDLMTRLPLLDPDRVPERTRHALAELVRALESRNPFLRPVANQAAAHLIGTGASSAGVRVDARLPAAADAGSRIRRRAQRIVRDPFTLQLAVTSTGQAELTVHAQVPESGSGGAALAPEPPDALLVPVRLLGVRGGDRFLVLLLRRAGGLVGRISLPVRPGAAIEADLAGPPLGGLDLPGLGPDEVVASIRAVGTRSGRAAWRAFVADLPDTHPLRIVVEGETR
ncbi:hypothetical protein [Actinomadura formosensis]|uniref:hypothetical protein n=1 Tax=Actinomadura formosensis TaxID=60706 RepID=UPI003D8EEE62